jgi:hypothetical protein
MISVNKSIVKDQNFLRKNFDFPEYSQGARLGNFSFLNYKKRIMFFVFLSLAIVFLILMTGVERVRAEGAAATPLNIVKTTANVKDEKKEISLETIKSETGIQDLNENLVGGTYSNNGGKMNIKKGNNELNFGKGSVNSLKEADGVGGKVLRVETGTGGVENTYDVQGKATANTDGSVTPSSANSVVFNPDGTVSVMDATGAVKVFGKNLPPEMRSSCASGNCNPAGPGDDTGGPNGPGKSGSSSGGGQEQRTFDEKAFSAMSSAADAAVKLGQGIYTYISENAKALYTWAGAKQARDAGIAPDANVDVPPKTEVAVTTDAIKGTVFGSAVFVTAEGLGLTVNAPGKATVAILPFIKEILPFVSALDSISGGDTQTLWVFYAKPGGGIFNLKKELNYAKTNNVVTAVKNKGDSLGMVVNGKEDTAIDTREATTGELDAYEDSTAGKNTGGITDILPFASVSAAMSLVRDIPDLSPAANQFVKFSNKDIQMSGKNILFLPFKPFNKLSGKGSNLVFDDGDTNIEFEGIKIYYPRTIEESDYFINKIVNENDGSNYFRLIMGGEKGNYLVDGKRIVSVGDNVTDIPLDGYDGIIIPKERYEMWKKAIGNE